MADSDLVWESVAKAAGFRTDNYYSAVEQLRLKNSRNERSFGFWTSTRLLT